MKNRIPLVLSLVLNLLLVLWILVSKIDDYEPPPSKGPEPKHQLTDSFLAANAAEDTNSAKERGEKGEGV